MTPSQRMAIWEKHENEQKSRVPVRVVLTVNHPTLGVITGEDVITQVEFEELERSTKCPPALKARNEHPVQSLTLKDNYKKTWTFVKEILETVEIVFVGDNGTKYTATLHVTKNTLDELIESKVPLASRHDDEKPHLAVSLLWRGSRWVWTKNSWNYRA